FQDDVLAAEPLAGDAGVVGAPRVGREIPAAVRRNDLEAGEPVERALEYQMLERDRGLERIADQVPQKAVAGQYRIERRNSHRMDKENGAQFLGLLPHRMEFGIREGNALDRSADRSAAQPLFLDRRLEFLAGKLRVLQSQRAERGEPIAMGGDEVGE